MTSYSQPPSLQPPRIGSQLEPIFNEAVEALTGLHVQPLPNGPPECIPPEICVLAASPWIASGDVLALRASRPPPGWPFNLQWIQLLTSGIDMYPDWFLDSVPVSTARGAAAESIAEYVLAALLGAVRGMPDIWIHHQADWKPRFAGSFFGSQVGVVGYGPIGHAIARKSLALGAQVSVLRQSQQPLDLDGACLAADIHALAAQADHLVLCAPVSPQTRGMIDAEVLAKARPGLHLVNVGRGELIDEDAVLEALNSGRLSRATLDVTKTEPLPEAHSFYRHPRVNVSPHSAAVSARTRLSLAAKVAENLRRYKNGQSLLDQLHFDAGKLPEGSERRIAGVVSNKTRWSGS